MPNQEGWKVLTKHASYTDEENVEISWKEEVLHNSLLIENNMQCKKPYAYV